jgi:hypothetical protein
MAFKRWNLQGKEMMMELGRAQAGNMKMKEA